MYHPSYVLRAADAASRRQAYKVIVDGLRWAQELLKGFLEDLNAAINN